MPAFYTHYTFVKKNTDVSDQFFPIQALGGQGPDVFFFYGYSLKKREKKAEKRYFGTYIHHINISDAYSFLLEYASKQEDSEMLFSYLKGLFMHYVMDRNCHPYIFYRTGFADSKTGTEEDKKKYMNIHVGFEGVMDTIIGKENKTFKNPKKCAKCPENQVKSVSRMFFELAKYLNYKDIDELTYYHAFKDLLFAESILHSPLGIKKFFVHNIFCKGSYIDCMMSPSRTKPFEKYDILNLKKDEWCDCVTGEKHNESFLELVKNAQEEIKQIDKLIEKAAKKENIRDDMVLFINNIDHDGFTVNAEKVHYKNYLDMADTK